MTTKRKGLGMCDSEGGCVGYGVLKRERNTGPQTATQKLAGSMKGAEVDLSRATGNAMLGTGMHPYRLSKGDVRKPARTASDKFMTEMNANSTPPSGPDTHNSEHNQRTAMDGATFQKDTAGATSSREAIAPPGEPTMGSHQNSQIDDPFEELGRPSEESVFA